MVNAFGCDRFTMELFGTDINKLGNIDYQTFVLGEKTTWSLEDFKNNRNEPELTVVNAYTQFNYGRNYANANPLSYEAPHLK
jgi:hypothetical protein